MWTPAGGRDPRVCGPRPARTRTSASIYARPPCSDARRLRDTPHAILKKRPVRHVIHVGARLLLRGAHGVTYTPRARTLRLRTKELGRDPLSTSTSQTPRRRRRANPAGIGCGGQRRSMDGRCASKSRGRGWLRRGGECARCDMCLQRMRLCQSPRSIGSPCARPPPAARR